MKIYLSIFKGRYVVFFYIVFFIFLIFLYGLQFNKNENNWIYEKSIQFNGADLTGANLSGSLIRIDDLRGAVLCNTVMPDGKINNLGCK